MAQQGYGSYNQFGQYGQLPGQAQQGRYPSFGGGQGYGYGYGQRQQYPQGTFQQPQGTNTSDLSTTPPTGDKAPSAAPTASAPPTPTPSPPPAPGAAGQQAPADNNQYPPGTFQSGGLGQSSTGPVNMAMGQYGAPGAWDGGYNATPAPPPASQSSGSYAATLGGGYPTGTFAPPAAPAQSPAQQPAANAGAQAAPAIPKFDPMHPLAQLYAQTAAANQRMQQERAMYPSAYPALSNGMTLGPVGTNSPGQINAYYAQMRQDAAAAYQANPTPQNYLAYQRSLNSMYDPIDTTPAPQSADYLASVAALNAAPAYTARTLASVWGGGS
jgi:hypothetical protein